MATIESRIEALEQTHFGKNPVNVFLRRFADEVPITRAAYRELMIEQRQNETQDQFELRAVMEAQELTCDSSVRVFDLWLFVDRLEEVA